jgi:hypothetical protein
MRVIIGNRNPAMKKQLIEKPNRLDRELMTIRMMIELYCRKKHHPKTGLCQDCAEMLEYSAERLSRCHFGSSKPACSKCTVHCYQWEYRDRIKVIMRFSGPRMLINHPGFLVSHYLDFFRYSSQKS